MNSYWRAPRFDWTWNKAVFTSSPNHLAWQMSKSVPTPFPTENFGSTQGLGNENKSNGVMFANLQSLPHLIDKQGKSWKLSWVGSACLKVISTLKSCNADASRMSCHSLILDKKSLIPYKNQRNVHRFHILVGYRIGYIFAFALGSFYCSTWT